MSTTMDDVVHEMAFEKQYKEYITSIEKVAASKSIDDLKTNLQLHMGGYYGKDPILRTLFLVSAG